MRPTLGFVATALLCLAGSGLDARTMPAPPPAGYAVGVIPLQAPTDGRASQIDTCVADAPVRLPNGTNTTLVCTCAIDKMMASGVGRSDAILQCAVQMHIPVPELRASEIGDCVRGASEHLPDGTNATAFCTCAVDKMLTHSTPQLDAVNQCATEMRITLRNLD